MSGYIDEDFALYGSKPALWAKPPPLTNSQLTSTTRRLAQNSLYQADNYRDLRRSLEARPVVRSSDSDSIDGLNYEIELTKERWAAENAKREILNDYDWYTRPAHLTQNVPSAIDSLSRKIKMPSRSVSPELVRSEYFRRRDDDLVRAFFPVTLGSSYALNATESPFRIYQHESRSSKSKKAGFSSLPDRPKTAKPATSSAKTHITNSSSIFHSESPFKDSSEPVRASLKKSRRPHSARQATDVDKMYNMVAEAPVINSSSVFRNSPYQTDVATLRMKQLQLEEQIILEIKRQEELERIRGPKPKWYELKTPQFHYEAQKNNELLKHENNWQELMDYRNELVHASKQLQRTANLLNEQMYE